MSSIDKATRRQLEKRRAEFDAACADLNFELAEAASNYIDYLLDRANGAIPADATAEWSPHGYDPRHAAT